MTSLTVILCAALAVPALLRRPPWAPLTVLWQLRGPLAVASLVAALGLAAEAWRRDGTAAAARDTRVVGLAGAAAAALARGHLERARGRRHTRLEGPHGSLHVVTHNCGLHRSDPVRVAAFLADCGADVVALQELEPLHERALAAAMVTSHPYQVVHATGIDGLALASRYPIRASRLEQLDSAHPYLVCDLDAPGGPLRVVVFHPPAALAVVGRGHAAVHDLARLARDAAAHAPALVVGDLNSTDATEAWDALRAAGLVDVFQAVGQGSGVTFPVPFKYLALPVPPLVRIDFVFATPDLVPCAAEVGPPTTSDHLPLFATLARRRAADDAAAAEAI